MNRQEWLEEVKQEIMKRDDTFRVEVRQVRLNNSEKEESIVILQGEENIAPLICLDSFYEMALAGEDIRTVTDRIMELHQERKLKKPVDVSLFLDWERIRPRIVRRVISADRNRELLENVPHRIQMDLAVVYYYLMDQFETGQASVLVRDDSMKLWQITGEDLEEAASENMPLLTPPVFKGMSEMMQEMLGMSVPGQDTPDSLYVLTNQQKCYGAVYMLDETVLAGISDQLGDAFFILPSSIHECMVLPCLPGFDPGRLAELVREVNRTQVDPQEVLSDSVYRYDRSACSLQRVC